MLSFDEPPEELIAWMECIEWMKDVLEEWKKKKNKDEYENEGLLKKLTLASKEGEDVGM